MKKAAYMKNNVISAWNGCFIAVLFFLSLTGVRTFAIDSLMGDFMKELAAEANKDDLALISNSFMGSLRFWNGVDSNNLTPLQRNQGHRDRLAEAAQPWGWRFNVDTEKIERIPDKNIPISALLAVPESTSYRIWLRRVAGRHPIKLKISGVNKAEHVFGVFPLTGDASAEQEKTLPIHFEDEAIRMSFPSESSVIWEYWDVDLKEGDSLFELSSTDQDARFSHIFITASKTFRPGLPTLSYRIFIGRRHTLLNKEQHRSLSRVYYRFRMRDTDVAMAKVEQALMRYLWKFDPLDDTGNEGIRYVGLRDRYYRDSDRRNFKNPEIPVGEWSEWVDASWSSQGAGSWGQIRLLLEEPEKGKCDVQLAWHPDPAAVVKAVTADIEEGLMRVCAPLVAGGRGRVVFPDRENEKGVWGFFGQRYLDYFRTIDGFNEQYMAWIKEAKERLGITEDPVIPDGIDIYASISGAVRSEEIALGKTLKSMGFNQIIRMHPDVCREIGFKPRLTAGTGRWHTSDPADPARDTLIRNALLAEQKRREEEMPGFSEYVRTVKLGDEIGPIAGIYKINQSRTSLRRFREYLASVLEEKGETPAFFGVESLDELKGLEGQPDNPGIFERRLFNHSVKFRTMLTADYYRPITEVAQELFPNARTYANYSPAGLRQVRQYWGLDWMKLHRTGALGMAVGEDWVYRGFVGYEDAGYYAALVECAARNTDCYTGFYNVAGGSVMRCDGNIISALSRGMRQLLVFNFGPSYNASMCNWEGSWSHVEAVYDHIIRALHSAGFVGRHLVDGQIEQRKVALLYNRDHEIMNGGHHGEQSDRMLTFVALANCGYNADLILNVDLTPEILSQYSALFINGFCFPRASVPAIREWVENGGLLVASANSAIYDEYNTPLSEMEDIFGARRLNMSISHGYISPGRLHEHDPIGEITIKDTDFSPALDAKVIGMKTGIEPSSAVCIAVFEDGTSAATLNKIGVGHVLLWGIQPGIIYKGGRGEISRYIDERLAIFEKPLRKVLGEPDMSADAPQMEMTRFDLDGETAVLVNNFRRHEWSPDLPPATVRIRTAEKVTRVASALAGELKWRMEGDRIVIEYPVPETVDSILVQ